MSVYTSLLRPTEPSTVGAIYCGGYDKRVVGTSRTIISGFGWISRNLSAKDLQQLTSMHRGKIGSDAAAADGDVFAEEDWRTRSRSGTRSGRWHFAWRRIDSDSRRSGDWRTSGDLIRARRRCSRSTERQG